MHKVMQAAGLRQVRVHDRRHTDAALTIQPGVDIVRLSRRFRHSRIAITADIYAHAVPGGKRAAADVLENILTGNQAQPPRNHRR
jgi:integrase